MLVCVGDLLITAGIFVVGFLLLQWGVRELFDKTIPPRIEKVIMFIALVYCVIGFVICLAGAGEAWPAFRVFGPR